MLSVNIYRYKASIWHTYIHAATTFIHIKFKNIKLFKKECDVQSGLST